LGLRLSRSLEIWPHLRGLYLCRRWEDNTDAAIDHQKLNAFNHYKDQLRSMSFVGQANA
jgi:hypothetical protein